MKLKILISLAIAVVFGWQAEAQNYDTNGDYVQTFAGSGFSGDVNGVGMLTMFNNPNAIVVDSHSNLFFWDSGNYKIKEITPDGTVTTFAGGGNQTIGVGTNVNLFPVSHGEGFLAIDQNNQLWMATWPNSSSISLYRISSTASVTNFTVNIPTQSTFSVPEPVGLCVDSGGNVYLSIYYGNQIYKWSTDGTSKLFVGSGNQGHADGNGIFSSFSAPTALACDQADNIYVWDSGNYLMRRIDQTQNVTTITGQHYSNPQIDGEGTNAGFNFIGQMCFDNSGNLYLACGNCIRKIDATTNVVTLAGSFMQTGYTNGPGNLARFNGADGICVSGGTICVADSSNQRIRSITNNPTAQVVSGANLGIGNYVGVSITGIVGRTYQIQASPDMNSWNTVATVLLNSSPYLWIDQNPVSGNKFYRALLLP